MTHINLSITIANNSDVLSALSETLKIADALKENQHLNFGNFQVTAHPDSNILDLFEIYKAKKELDEHLSNSGFKKEDLDIDYENMHSPNVKPITPDYGITLTKNEDSRTY